jgi:hypothetical protein
VRRVVVRSVVARRVVERCSVVERSRRVVSVQLVAKVSRSTLPASTVGRQVRRSRVGRLALASRDLGRPLSG